MQYLGFMMTDIWRLTYCCSIRVRSGKFNSVSVEDSRTPEVDLAQKNQRSQCDFLTESETESQLLNQATCQDIFLAIEGGGLAKKLRFLENSV